MNRSLAVGCVVALAALAGCSDTAHVRLASEPVAAAPVAVPVVATGPAFELDATQLPDGAPITDPRVVMYGNESHGPEHVGLHVVAGALQATPVSGSSAGYMQVNLGTPVTRMGADFTLTPGARGGALALPLWATDWTQTGPAIPDAPMHFLLTAETWAYQVFDGGTLVGLQDGVFDPPLPTDTLLTIDITLAGDTATVALPDGTSVQISDPLIARPAAFPVFESYQFDAATMGRVRFARIWADG